MNCSERLPTTIDRAHRFINSFHERKMASVIRQIKTIMLSDGITYDGPEDKWEPFFDNCRRLVGDKWERYGPILERYPESGINTLKPELNHLWRTLRPLVDRYLDSLQDASGFERQRKQFLNGLDHPTYIKITFRNGGISQVAVRTGASVRKMPELFLSLVNIQINGRVEVNLGIVKDGPSILAGQSFFTCFYGDDAEVVLSNGRLFNTVLKELKDIAAMGCGIRGAVAGIERNSYNTMIIKQLHPLYKWYKANDVQSRTLYTYAELINGLFGLNFSDNFIMSTAGRK